ncbi:MAG: hypothetical protein R3181_13080 [Rubricoccaceae bacterium]|nr:hypothetical protein [Rubricoccaceae bacterium]
MRYFLLALALTLAACDGLTTPAASDLATAPAHAEARPVVPLVLTLGQSAPLREPGSSFTFDAVVSDDRCPVNMTCFHDGGIWAGTARTRFTLTTVDRSYPIALAIPGGHPGPLPLEAAPMAVAGGYVVRLVRLQPYPGWEPDGGMPATATVVVEPCPSKCVETWPPQVDH